LSAALAKDREEALLAQGVLTLPPPEPEESAEICQLPVPSAKRA
jgi:hypothetical protein